MYCVQNGFAGLENLSLIPGTVGASPIQNIGAYGVELKDVFLSCKAFEIETGKFLEFDKEACAFGYRESIFKQELKDKVIITSVNFVLSTVPSVNISYGAIADELKNRGITNPGIQDVSEVVSAIRVSKLPDPSTIGNSGSFFKNPIISSTEFERIKSSFPDTVHFCLPNSTVKLAAGWLIEKCGWKGKKIGETGTWKNQALVLVNHGNATGSDIYDLSSRIIKDVNAKFGVVLEREVNVL
jgi:UDP-N-acetylmuramate dehydrogenase